MRAIEITCQNACNKLKYERPYGYDLNIYRGCQHGCKYCYAMYSHDYVDGVKSGRFFKDIIVKRNIAEQLEKQFASPYWKRNVVNIGSVTDSYQPIEKEYELMRDILKIFIRFKNPCIISTKSKLILRDLDLIEELAAVAHVNVACTITAIDEKIREKIEPGAASSAERFQVVRELEATGASRGVHIMPMIPFLTDNINNIDCIYQNAKMAGADYVLPSFLNLKGPTRGTFIEFMKMNYPNIFNQFISLYNGDDAKRQRVFHKGNVYKEIRKLQERYNLYSNYMDFSGIKKNKDENIQLSFF